MLDLGSNPPTSVTVTLSSINVPRLGHGERDDEFFAWDAREFVRKKLLNKKVPCLSLSFLFPPFSNTSLTWISEGASCVGLCAPCRYRE